MIKIKIAWLLTFIALSVIIVPLIVYSELQPSTFCTNFGFLNPLTGGCFGSFSFANISLEHEGVGAGMVTAGIIFIAAAKQQSNPIAGGSVLIGMLLLISDCCKDFTNNPQGSEVSIALGFTYVLVFMELTRPTDLGSVEVPAG